MKIAIHAPNFIPWLPYFWKMAMVDKFIILRHVQFRREGWENRFNFSNGDKVTKPVIQGLDNIIHKRYVDGNGLYDLNIRWIEVIKDTLGIETQLVYDYPTDLKATERLIDLIQFYEGDTYVTNPEAKNKYLDEELIIKSGIKIEYCKVPRHLEIHVFEALERYGLEGTINQLPKKELCLV